MKLYIFVEGKNDIDFFEKILNSEIKRKFDEFECIPYAENMTKERNLILRIIKNNKNNYIFCPDLDTEYSEKKVNARKREIAEKYFKIDYDTVKEKMHVIVQKIESWYFAGFDKKYYIKKGIGNYYSDDAEEITKGTLKKIAKSLKKDPKIFISQITQWNYKIEIACRRNKSFKKFYNAILK